MGPKAKRCSVTLTSSWPLPSFFGEEVQALFKAVAREECTDPGLTRQGWAPQGDGPSQDEELRSTENPHQKFMA